ncbi:hypothetical protein RF11_01152 [Thelohanellus kitauei]|uniref:Uncharacterized protein n=1 Tax=Thelohanellus kitauei TaxID=669202 RepID=A0A0C2MBH3_THEKT|nr:hypothetical protein RF11_01152 [Thelohanellus kitauei]
MAGYYFVAPKCRKLSVFRKYLGIYHLQFDIDLQPYRYQRSLHLKTNLIPNGSRKKEKLQEMRPILLLFFAPYVYNNQSTFSRITTELSPFYFEDKCLVAISPYMPKVLYANIKNKYKMTPSTYISRDDRHTFTEMKLIIEGTFLVGLFYI